MTDLPSAMQVALREEWKLADVRPAFRALRANGMPMNRRSGFFMGFPIQTDHSQNG
jgi:hypothetical protein